ncbi:hypothetical protein ACFQLX_02655 [Streptomyces polyrhachis]|uniref:Holin n=1 Tax=Streptomyces polyrhachis TaxID=1282885 RepID=A0ABW2G8M0_9ACTN
MSDATRRTARTLVQTLLGLAAALPLLVDAAGVRDTTAGIGTALAVAGALTRLMALPSVQRATPEWLRTEAGVDAELRALAREVRAADTKDEH